MSVVLANLTFDCHDPALVAAFWSAALDRPLDAGAGDSFAAIGRDDPGPTWFFIKVPEPKSAKNRLHLDVVSPDPPAEVKRLLGLGATKLADKDEWGTSWTIMADPEGNEFCVAGTPA